MARDLGGETPQAGHAGGLDSREWFEAVFRAHHASLCGFVYRYVGSEEAAEDVVQELFCAVWADRDAWIARDDRIRRALFVAARNRALDFLKHGHVRSRHRDDVRQIGDARGPTPADDELLLRELMDEVEAAVGTLPERCRLVFSLSRDSGLTNPQVAEMLGVSVKAVEAQMTRALRTLRERLAPFLGSLLLLVAT